MKLHALYCAAIAAAAFGAASARADTPLYSFETLYSNPGTPVPDPQGTLPDGFHPNGGGSTAQSTIGATDGIHSLRWAQLLADSFTGAQTALGVPFPVINNTNTTAISVDLTVNSGDEFVGGFANLGMTEFGTNPFIGEGQAQTVAAAEQPIKLPAGTYHLLLPLIARANPLTFDANVQFAAMFGPDSNTQLTPASFQFYINKGPTGGANPLPNAPLTVYLDNVQAVSGQTSTWNFDADGDWSAADNWLGFPNAVPNGIDAIAMFALGPPLSGNRIVTVDSPKTVGTLYFNSGNAYTLAGANAITLDVSAGQANVNAVTGSHTVSAPLVLNDNTTVTVSNPASILTFSGPITATGRTITKAGGGRLDVSNVNAAALAINAGTVKVLAGGTVASTSKVNTLTIAGGATPTAKLDVSNNAFVVDYTGASPLATIKSQIIAAYNGGGANAWTGNGITTSNGNASNFAVGYGEASALSSVPAIFGTTDATSVLFRETRYGDATLDGTVNLADFNKLASSFGQTGKNWTDGDFNYDGTVNLGDFNLLASNFGLSAAGPEVTPQDWSNLASAVPEPSTLLLSGVPALAGMCMRRHARRAAAQLARNS
jgi:hypothetical protein